MDKKGPEKKDRLLAALDKGMVMIHLDARRPGVLVPASLRNERHLRLNLSYRFEPPDLTVGEWGVRCTLSFSGSRFTVAVPWSALFAIRSHSTEELWIYPDDMPPELIQATIPLKSETEDEPRGSTKALLREVAAEPVRPPPEASAPDKPTDDPPKPRGRGHLRVVK
jgi:stringent starvation protein B